MADDRLKQLLGYLPIAAVFASVVVSATSAQIQIGTNKENIATTKTEVDARVPTFLYDMQRRRIEAAQIDLAEAVDANEDKITDLIRASDEINAKVELEIERLRAQIERESAATAIKLEQILRLLEQNERNGNE